jgi:4-carboxymuconolactone decarboxylase
MYYGAVSEIKKEIPAKMSKDKNKEMQIMARLPNATPAQLSEFVRTSGLPENAPSSNAFRMLAHAPAVGAQALRLVLTLLTETELDPRLRELVILRVVQRCNGRYAWVQHAPMAGTVGVTNAQIAALERGEVPADLFEDRERKAFVLADEILETCSAKEVTFAAVHKIFSPREIVELVLLTGYFRMISGLMTTLDVEVESPFGSKVLDLVGKAVRGDETAHAGQRRQQRPPKTRDRVLTQFCALRLRRRDTVTFRNAT